jgi:L-serine dehydratase
VADYLAFSAAQDQCGVIALVSGQQAEACINIAGMRVFRTGKGGLAIMIIECDQRLLRIL